MERRSRPFKWADRGAGFGKGVAGFGKGARSTRQLSPRADFGRRRTMTTWRRVGPAGSERGEGRERPRGCFEKKRTWAEPVRVREREREGELGLGRGTGEVSLFFFFCSKQFSFFFFCFLFVSFYLSGQMTSNHFLKFCNIQNTYNIPWKPILGRILFTQMPLCYHCTIWAIYRIGFCIGKWCLI